MATKKKIIVLGNFKAIQNCVINQALYAGKILKQEIIFVQPSELKNKDDNSEDTWELKERITTLTTNISSSFSILKIDCSLQALPKLQPSLIVIDTANLNKKARKLILKFNRQSSTPCFFVPKMNDNPKPFQQVYLPLGYRTEERFKIVFATLFTNPKDTTVKIIAARQNSKISQKKVDHNVIFAKRLLKSKGIKFETITEDSCTFEIEKTAILRSAQNGHNLVFSSPIENLEILDLALMSKEKKVVLNTENIPVISIKPNKHLYKILSN